MATVPSVLGHSRVPSSRWSTFSYSRTWVRKNVVVEEGTIRSEEVPLPMDPPARQTIQVDFSQFWRSLTTTWVRTSFAWARGSNGMAGDCISKTKVISTEAPHNRQYALISDLLDLGNLSTREGAALAAIWIKDRPEGLKLQILVLATVQRIWLQMFSTHSKNASRWAQGNNWSFTGIHRQLQGIFRRTCHLFDVMCCRICNLSAVWSSRALSETNFDIFAANGESTAWVLLWKTRSRPSDVRVFPVAQFNSFSTAFDPRTWTLVVFWLKSLWRQPHLITPENEGGDDTNYPSPPNATFFDDLEVPFGPQCLQPPAPPEPHQPPGPPGSPGFPPGWPPATPPSGQRGWEPEIPRVQRLHPRSVHPEPQLIPKPMSDGEDDDDQPPQEERQRQRSGSRERVRPHATSAASNHKFDLRLLQNLMMRCQMRVLRLLIPHHHQLDHNHQLNRGVASENPKDRDHVSE